MSVWFDEFYRKAPLLDQNWLLLGIIVFLLKIFNTIDVLLVLKTVYNSKNETRIKKTRKYIPLVYIF
ncbi:hypothetical protein B0A58_13740 [Flavobacterium branchiophilum NBRC 15030 = ATCC 35035]|nr:hypothetical protein B0A58_13740 [Flavobacterium branchiophilum NBRC 15030 = ATCC 35035]